MNSIEAKKLNLPEIMSRLGYEPTSIKKGGNEYWYNSPFRPEKESSFHTSYLGGKWIWNDFGDQGGTVIDFVMRHEGYSSVSKALSFLDDMYSKVGNRITNKPSFSFQQHLSAKPKFSESKELEFLSAKPIENTLILSYLIKERGINKDIALQYLEEVRYKNIKTQKEYFAFGIKNESNGYEVRVASDKYPFKSALIKKDISLIKGFKTNKVVNVFEGMTDFLSLLTMMKTDSLHGDTILMHSLSSYEKTIKSIKEQGCDSINTFLDNNKAGQECTEKFKTDFGAMVHVQSQLFLPFVDINDMLKAQSNDSLKSNSFFR